MNFSAQTIGTIEIAIGLIGLFGIWTIILLDRHRKKHPYRKRDLLLPVINLMRGVLGWFLIVIGLIMTPLPIPFGIITVLMGIAVLGPRSRRLRLLFYHVRRGLRHLARTAPPFIQRIAHAILEFERKVTATHRRRQWDRKQSAPTAHPDEPSPPAEPMAISLPEPKAEPIWRGVDDADNDFRHSEQEAAR
ncbi:MAG: hypothetical protein HC911_03035 [Chloroflexaceae bacterium]|nr:hypothetical protein [Chloroflexaceae bacterium]